MGKTCARGLSEGCVEMGMDLEGSVTVPGGTTSTCVFILDEHGDLSQAIADMGILDSLTPSVLERRLDLIDRATACFVDTNISRESLRFLAEHVSTPPVLRPRLNLQGDKALWAAWAFPCHEAKCP